MLPANEEESKERKSEILIGVGGWAYLPIRHQNKLKICAEIFDFVEVNSSFYKLPTVEQAKKWRSSVPETFEFTVRANGKLTHEHHLEPTEENERLFRSNMAVCKALAASILHFQFPPSFEVSSKVVENWREFMSTVERKRDYRTDLAFEIRNTPTASADYVRSFFDDYDIIPTSDLSKDVSPLISKRSKVLYSRVFGNGDHTRWSFSTGELEKLKEKVENVPARRRYVTFHNVTMYEDAARMKNIVDKDQDSLPSGLRGLDSLKRSIIDSRVKFPVTKKGLLKELSWRTIDIDDGQRVHPNAILEKLSDKSKFQSIDQVMHELHNSSVA